jgi:hypothetical protein
LARRDALVGINETRRCPKFPFELLRIPPSTLQRNAAAECVQAGDVRGSGRGVGRRDFLLETARAGSLLPKAQLRQQAEEAVASYAGMVTRCPPRRQNCHGRHYQKEPVSQRAGPSPQDQASGHLRPRTRRPKAIIDGGNHPRDAARDGIRQRKRPRFLLRHLLFRGDSIRAVAGAAFSGRGRLFCSNRPGLKRAYPPAWFYGKLVPLASRATGSVHRLVAGRG